MTPQPIDSTHPDADARHFAGLDRLYGLGAVQQLAQSCVAVVGLGGVGSWAAEGLARSGVGALMLIDLDHVAASNINRQIQALHNTIGMAKVQALAQRIAQINPACKVTCIEDFVDSENTALLLPSTLNAVLDCTDQVRAKAAMAAHCIAHKIPIVMCGAAGGKTNPLALQTTDLALCSGDPLLANVRYRLRKHYGFAKAPTAQQTAKKPKTARFNIPVIYSNQPVAAPQTGIACETDAAPQGLNCAGYGSSVTVTAPMGFAAAGLVLNHLLQSIG